MNAGHNGQRDFFRRFGADIQTDRPECPVAYTRTELKDETLQIQLSSQR
ncbi:hypothetical protein [Methylobacter sp. YRD-M1]|nr:hypothetical protein [Methylobacter sp. YRD-M1]WAK02377.1 hypothetical protein LZ558_00925 [Methylobacter sp. YRD-M1]